MNKSHKRAIRRDRRKAKATDWRRPGKTSMGGHVGHGTVGAGHKSFVKISHRKPQLPELVSLGLLVEVAVEIRSRPPSSLKATLEAIRNQRVKK